MKIKLSKIHIYSAGFSIVALLLIFFLVYPTIKDIKHNSNKILENKSELIFADEQSKSVEEFKDSYYKYESNFKKIDQILVDSKNPVDLIEFIELSGLELGLGLNINLLESGKKENMNGLNSVNFNINAAGEFYDILNFSKKLENGPYLVKIKSLSISKSSADSKDKTVDAQFLIYVGAQNL